MVIVHSRARVALPLLVIRPRRRLADGVLWATLLLSLAAGLAFFRWQWQQSEEELGRVRAAWRDERDSRTSLTVHLDQGVECQTPYHSPLWTDVVKKTCSDLGQAYRDLVLNPAKRAKR